MQLTTKIDSVLLLSILTVLCSTRVSSATSYVLRPEAHSVYVDQRDPDINFVDKRGILVASESGENARSVIRFDLGDWTPNVDSISNARLYLFHYRGGSYAGSRTIEVYSLTNAFEESTATWNFPWTTPGGDYDVSFSASAEIPEAWENWAEWDVTDILRNRWGNVAQYGFLLRDPIEDSPPPDGPYVRFRSHRYQDEAPQEIPYLLVQIGRPSGDADQDGTVILSDALYVLNYLFRNGPAPDPIEAGDANCDHQVDLSDALRILNYLFKGQFVPGCVGPPQ